MAKMTTTRRKRVITIETRQKTVIRQDSQHTYQRWCELCAAEVEMTTPKSAAHLLGVSQREIFRRIEQGSLHFVELETGEVFICAKPIKPKQIGEK
jgi:hypothetical protein